MKKQIFAWAVIVALVSSCNNSGDTTTTHSDSTTTVMDDNSSTGKMNSNDAGGSTMDTSRTASAPADAETTEFVSKAASGGMMEVELGNIAKDKAQSQRVKDFGAMMVTDHSAANNELKSTAQANNITVPAAMMAEHQKHVDMIKAKSGRDFDKAYMSMMLDDHKKDVAEFKKASTDLKNDAVKAFAGRTLPTLQKHLDSAQAINKKM